jgi:hypothetical protein
VILLQGTPDAATFRRVLDSVFAAPAYRWAEDPGAVRVLRDWWRELGDWLETLRVDNPAFFRTLVALLLVGLILLLGHAAWVLWKTVLAGGGSVDQPAAPAPREVRDAEWYYREADRVAADGRWRDALQLRFVGLALSLDAQGLLRYHPSKTPAECVRDATLIGTDRERLRDLVRALYAHGFGSHPCGPDDYRRWRETGDLSWHASGR